TVAVSFRSGFCAFSESVSIGVHPWLKFRLRFPALCFIASLWFSALASSVVSLHSYGNTDHESQNVSSYKRRKSAVVTGRGLNPAVHWRAASAARSGNNARSTPHLERARGN